MIGLGLNSLFFSNLAVREESANLIRSGMSRGFNTDSFVYYEMEQERRIRIGLDWSASASLPICVMQWWLCTTYVRVVQTKKGGKKEPKALSVQDQVDHSSTPPSLVKKSLHDKGKKLSQGLHFSWINQPFIDLWCDKRAIILCYCMYCHFALMTLKWLGRGGIIRNNALLMPNACNVAAHFHNEARRVDCTIRAPLSSSQSWQAGTVLVSLSDEEREGRSKDGSLCSMSHRKRGPSRPSLSSWVIRLDF